MQENLNVWQEIDAIKAKIAELWNVAVHNNEKLVEAVNEKVNLMENANKSCMKEMYTIKRDIENNEFLVKEFKRVDDNLIKLSSLFRDEIKRIDKSLKNYAIRSDVEHLKEKLLSLDSMVNSYRFIDIFQKIHTLEEEFKKKSLELINKSLGIGE